MKGFPAAARLALAAALELQDGEVCFVGIGNPSDAALLAKHTHAPDMSLIYESGVIGVDALTRWVPFPTHHHPVYRARPKQPDGFFRVRRQSMRPPARDPANDTPGRC